MKLWSGNGEATIIVFKTTVEYFPGLSTSKTLSHLVFLQQSFDVNISIPISEMGKKEA